MVVFLCPVSPDVCCDIAKKKFGQRLSLSTILIGDIHIHQVGPLGCPRGDPTFGSLGDQVPRIQARTWCTVTVVRCQLPNLKIGPKHGTKGVMY